MNVSEVFSSENLAKYWRYCHMYGLKNATRLAFGRMRKPKGAPPADPLPLSMPSGPLQARTPVTRKVSVIIPTKNAGEEFEELLRRLQKQEAIGKCEVVIVDSGSSDGTVAIAKRHGAQVVHIPPAEFTHAFARNRGSELGDGEYLLFLVQDALPDTDYWLWQMITALEANNLAAVSCAEQPRPDADLFYRFFSHTQYETQGLNRDRIMAWDQTCSSYMGVRSNAQLSDIAALIRHDIFKHYRYRSPYAEDLELGLRLIRDGHRLGFLNSVRVVHSHNRSAYHFLKRAYADMRFLVDVFPNFLYPTISAPNRLYAEIALLYSCVCGLAEMLAAASFPISLLELLSKIREALTRIEYRPCTKSPDSELQAFVQQLPVNMRPGLYLDFSHSMLLPHVRAHFDQFRDWLSTMYQLADQGLAIEIMSAVGKIAALHCGSHLAYLFLSSVSRKDSNQPILAMDRILTSGL